MDLREVEAELVEEIKYSMASLERSTPIDDLSDALETLGAQFEAIALCRLQAQADVERFRESLTRSGHARCYFLRRSKAEKNLADPHLALSRSRALLACMAAGSFSLAREISLLSARTWNDQWEYEDDFCYHRLLHLAVEDPSGFNEAKVAPLLEQFERALEGASSVRFELCKAFVARDSKAFTGALESLLAVEESDNEEKQDSLAEEEEILLFWPNRAVSVEGLGLLKVAEFLKLSVTKEKMKLCPKIARAKWKEKDFLDLLEEMERP